MKLFLRILGSVTAGVLGTLVILVATLLTLLARTPDVGTRTEGFFGAVFFEATPRDSASFMMNVGLADPLPLLISVVAIAVVAFVAMLIYARLLDYRLRLLQS